MQINGPRASSERRQGTGYIQRHGKGGGNDIRRAAGGLHHKPFAGRSESICGHPRFHYFEAIRKVPAEMRWWILEHYHQTYRARAGRTSYHAGDYGSRPGNPFVFPRFHPRDGRQAATRRHRLALRSAARAVEADLCERWKAGHPSRFVRPISPFAEITRRRVKVTA